MIDIQKTNTGYIVTNGDNSFAIGEQDFLTIGLLDGYSIERIPHLIIGGYPTIGDLYRVASHLILMNKQRDICLDAVVANCLQLSLH